MSDQGNDRTTWSDETGMPEVFDSVEAARKARDARRSTAAPIEAEAE